MVIDLNTATREELDILIEHLENGLILKSYNRTLGSRLFSDTIITYYKKINDSVHAFQIFSNKKSRYWENYWEDCDDFIEVNLSCYDRRCVELLDEKTSNIIFKKGGKTKDEME